MIGHCISVTPAIRSDVIEMLRILRESCVHGEHCDLGAPTDLPCDVTMTDGDIERKCRESPSSWDEDMS